MAKFDPNKSPAYILIFAAVISSLFTAAIMAVYVATEPIMKANRQLLVQRQIVDVFDLAGEGPVDTLPGAEVRTLYDARVMATDAEGYPVDLDGIRVSVQPAAPGPGPAEDAAGPHYYWAFAEGAADGDAPVAVAVPFSGIGFWALIRGYVSIDLATKRSIDFIVLEHSETPGLGGRITEENFKKRWRGLDMTAPADGGKWVYIDQDTPSAGSPSAGRHVDALTGATGTSRATEGFVNVDLPREVPAAYTLAARIRKNMAPRPARPHTDSDIALARPIRNPQSEIRNGSPETEVTDARPE